MPSSLAHRVLAALAVVGLAPWARAQFSSPLVKTDVWPYDLAAGDLDGDGDVDLVALGFELQVIVARGAGSGAFEPSIATPLPGFDDLLDAAVADLDGDGAGEVLLAADTGTGPTDLVLLSRVASDGTLDLPEPHDVSAGARDLAVTDLDLDGWLDVAVACADGTRISLLHGDGAGSLAAQVDLFAGDSPQAIAAADLTGDGWPDLLVALAGDGADALALLESQATGYLPPQLVSLGLPPTDVALGDIDADGDLDVAIGTAAGADALVLLNLDRGQLAQATPVTITDSPVEIALADVDEDGDADLLAAPDLGASVVVLASDGDGTFEPLATCGGAWTTAGLLVSDLNGDGDPDIATALHLPPVFPLTPWTLHVLPGDGEGAFGPFASLPDFTYEIAPGDYDADGTPDLAIGGGAPPSGASLVLAGAEGTFHAPTVSVHGSDVRAVAVCDFDGDGRLDVVSGDWFTGAVNLLPGDGGGGLGPPKPLPLPPGGDAHDLVAQEVDGLPGIDLLVARSYGKAVTLVRNDGSGGVLATQTIGTGSLQPHFVRAADATGDGLLDIVVADWLSASGAVGLLRGQGGGAFSPPAITAVPGGAGSLDLGDVDLDGDLDAAVSTFGVSILLLEQGVFLPPQFIAVPDVQTVAARLVDLDGDGLLDLAVADSLNTTPGLHAFLAGLGGGAFAEPVYVEGLVLQNDLAVTDVDLDGAPDVAFSALGTIGVLRNVDGPWQPLGHALAGTQGLPELLGSGTLQPGRPVELLLDDARPGAAATLVIGATALSLPFKGGLLVPSPDRLLTAPVDPAGQLLLEGSLPDAPLAGLELWLQTWIEDPQAVQGFAASGALAASFP